MKRYLKLIAIFLGATLSAQMEYRANFVGALLTSVAEVGVALLGLGVLFGQPEVSSVGGWKFEEALLVVGFFMLTQGVTAVFIQPNMSKIAEAVRTGSMDFTLLKPVDAQFNVSTRHLNILRITDIFLGLGILFYAGAKLDITGTGIVIAAWLYFCAIGMVYAIWLGLSTTAFWFVKTENAGELFNGVFGAARFPVTSFPAPVRIVLTFVLPIAFISTVPAQALLGDVPITLVMLAPLISVALLVITRLFWLKAVGSYTSASS